MITKPATFRLAISLVMLLSATSPPQDLSECLLIDTSGATLREPLELIELDSARAASLFRSVLYGEPEFSEGYAKGVEEALTEIREQRISWYTYGLRMYGGNIDEETGLPITAIAGCKVNSGVIGRASAHDSTIAAYIETNGLPSYSRKPWMHLIRRPKQTFDSLAQEQSPCNLMPMGSECRSGNSDFAVRLGKWQHPHSENTSDWVYVLGLDDSSEVGNFVGHLDERVKQALLTWAPPEAEIAFLRVEFDTRHEWHTGPQYLVLDLRTGGQIKTPGFVIVDTSATNHEQE